MKKTIFNVFVVVLLTLSVALLAFGCKTQPAENNDQTPTGQQEEPAKTCTEHVFDENGVCEVCGTWDGVSTPTKEIIDQYCDKYLSNIRAESYPDFAKEYDFDFEKDPELIDQGLFWTWYDPEINVVREVSIRDRQEVDKLIADGRIDPNKPNIIFVHGIAVAQYSRTILTFGDEVVELPSDGYGLLTSSVVLDPNLPEFAPYVDYTGNVNLNLVFLKNGYNVLNFVYTRFADEVATKRTVECDDGVTRTMTYANNKTIEQKVYSTEGDAGMRYRKSDGVFSDGKDISGKVVAEVHEDVKFSVAEYFAAEYVRMYSYMLEKNVFNKDTHMEVSGHSMGGVVTTIGTYLLTELTRVGQIPQDYVPDRIALQDSYFGVYSDYGEVIPTYSELTEKEKSTLKTTEMMMVHGINVHWSGKKMTGAGTAPLYLTALRQVVRDYGVVAEYYVDESGLGKGGMAFASIPAPVINELIRNYTSTIAYVFKFTKSFSSHNGVREAHVASLLYPVYKDVDGNITASASATDEQIKAACGKQWYLYKGNSTSTMSDDVMKTYEGKATPPIYDEE